jgi:hypothetical protein
MHLSHHLTEKITLYIASLARGAIPEMVTAVVLGTVSTSNSHHGCSVGRVYSWIPAYAYVEIMIDAHNLLCQSLSGHH